MAAAIATFRFHRTGLWRSLFAALISLALVTSLFHGCCCFDGDETTITASVVQPNSDAPGKTAPCSSGVHCCHCLAHATAPETVPIAAARIEYVKRVDRVMIASVPDSALPDSLFKPPRV